MESPIQKVFAAAAATAGIFFDAEVQVSRYRVDFVDRTRRVVIELDGHDFHKSKEQRTYDAQRDRALQREGYTVLRFTGTEIHQDIEKCIEEVKQTLDLWEPQLPPTGAIYIDWQFFDRCATALFRDYSSQYTEKNLERPRLSSLLDFIAGYLPLDGRFDVHLFGTASSFSTSLTHIDAFKRRVAKRATFMVGEHQHDFIACALVEHLHKEGTKYDYISLIADDPTYPPLLSRGRRIDVLFRRDSGATAMQTVEASKWQLLQYLVGYSLGLSTHEL